MAHKRNIPKRKLGKYHPNSTWSKVVNRLEPKWGFDGACEAADILLHEFGAEAVSAMIRRGVI